jgi:hypothetical protein
MSAIPSPLTPAPPLQKINNNKQTNEKYTNIVQPCGTSNNTSWNIWESSTLLIECLSVSIDSNVYTCLNVPSWLVAVSLFSAMRSCLLKRIFCYMYMYCKENCMWNSIFVTIVKWIAINDLILYFFSSDSDIQQSSQSIEVFSQRTQILWLRGRQYGPKRNI